MQPKPISDFSNGDLVFLRENMDAGEVRETFYCLQLGADTKYEGNLPVMALGCAQGDYEYADSPPRYRAFRASPIPSEVSKKLPVLPLSESKWWKYCHSHGLHRCGGRIDHRTEPRDDRTLCQTGQSTASGGRSDPSLGERLRNKNCKHDCKHRHRETG